MIEDILYIFPQHIKSALMKYLTSEVEEIRIGLNRPILLLAKGQEQFLQSNGEPVFASRQDIENILCLCSDYSMYLKEDEIHKGFMTIKGGCRVGLCGTVSYLHGRIINHSEITSLNIRIAKEVIGCSRKLLPKLLEDGRLKSTLVVSPPKGGKTTLLRDMARALSDDYKLRVGIVDERKELYGVGKYDLGLRSDVLQGCKKSEGIMMLVRTMAPDVIMVDELGGLEDISAIEVAGNLGVSMIASVHGKDGVDVKQKGLEDKFSRYVFLEDYNNFHICKGEEL